jgi:hypothetical protein
MSIQNPASLPVTDGRLEFGDGSLRIYPRLLGQFGNMEIAPCREQSVYQSLQADKFQPDLIVCPLKLVFYILGNNIVFVMLVVHSEGLKINSLQRAFIGHLVGLDCADKRGLTGSGLWRMIIHHRLFVS